MERDGLLGKVIIIVIALAVLGTLADAAASRRRTDAEPEPRVLTVHAEAYVEARPDVARVSLGVSALRPTPKQAAAQVDQTVSAIKAKLGELGVGAESLEASRLFLHAATEHDYRTGRTRHLGYKGSHQLRISLKGEAIDRLSDVIDAALGAGATDLSGLSFGIDDEGALRAEALGKATAQARERAEVMAAAAKATIVGIKEISDRTGDDRAAGLWSYAPAKRSLEAGALESPPATEAPDKLRVTAEVEIAFLLR